jgi:hypothetical protein
MWPWTPPPLGACRRLRHSPTPWCQPLCWLLPGHVQSQSSKLCGSF